MMQKNLKTVRGALIAFLLLVVTPCMAVDQNKLDVKPFDNLEVKGGIDVDILPSSSCRVEVIAEDKYKELIDIENSGKTLKISMRPSRSVKFYSKGSNKVIVYTPSLDKIKIVGSSHVRVPKPFDFKESLTIEKCGSGDLDGNIKVNNFRLNTNGSGDFELSMICDNMVVYHNGSGSIESVVKCQSFDLHFNGSGDHDIKITDATKGNVYSLGSGDIDANIQSKELKMDNTGSGDLDLTLLTKTFKINKNGSGNVAIKGKTYESNITGHGSGDITAKNFKSMISNITLSGSGSMSVYAKERLGGVVSSSGNLYYRGAPELKVQKHGSGSIRHIN
ncbi:MAG: GIN domain-containing protein [Prolixibacteraceae bacterium]